MTIGYDRNQFYNINSGCRCYTTPYFRFTDIFSVVPYFILGFIFHFTEIGEYIRKT